MPLVALAPPGGQDALDRYELLFRFAAGGMAEVFVARQRGAGGFLRPVAVKRMLPALAEEPKFVEMFLDEARLAAFVQSPHVVQTLDCGKDAEGSPYIVMELIVGVSLAQALRACVERKIAVPPAIVAELIAQTALGLYDAHHARTPTGQPLEIVHRDVSPQNILVGVDGRARLTDFGVARALEKVSRTSTGEVKGKLSYFSPEQARMERLDQRSDLFALGIVAWEALALERLFSRESPMAALQAVLYERIPDVRELNPDVPERLALAVARALERDVERRYPNGRAFADEFRAAVGMPATASAIGAWVTEAGGAKLAAFRKKIEHAFHERRADHGVETSTSQERERTGSLPTPTPMSVDSVQSQLVGRIEAPPAAPPATLGGTRTELSPPPDLDEPPRSKRPAGSTPRLELAVDDLHDPTPARRSKRGAVLVGALTALGLLVGAFASMSVQTRSAEVPDLASTPSSSEPPTTVATLASSEPVGLVASSSSVETRDDEAPTGSDARTQGARRGASKRPTSTASAPGAPPSLRIEHTAEPQRAEPQRAEPVRSPMLEPPSEPRRSPSSDAQRATSEQRTERDPPRATSTDEPVAVTSSSQTPPTRLRAGAGADRLRSGTP